MKNTKNDLTRLSRFISLVLRHNPQTVKITVEREGAWTDTKTLIENINRYSKYEIDMKILERIVEEDEKKRYSFSPDKSKIRANQGHSIDVDMGFAEKEPPEILYHGTTEKAAEIIMEEGLKKMGRNFVHLSADEETALKVGKRRTGETYIFRIHAGEMYRQGYKFYCSDNGVWQAEFIPPNFLE